MKLMLSSRMSSNQQLAPQLISPITRALALNPHEIQIAPPTLRAESPNRVSTRAPQSLAENSDSLGHIKLTNCEHFRTPASSHNPFIFSAAKISTPILTQILACKPFNFQRVPHTFPVSPVFA